MANSEDGWSIAVMSEPEQTPKDSFRDLPVHDIESLLAWPGPPPSRLVPQEKKTYQTAADMFFFQKFCNTRSLASLTQLGPYLHEHCSSLPTPSDTDSFATHLSYRPPQKTTKTH